MTTFTGRIGKIIESVRDLSNEPSQGFVTDEFLLKTINRCVSHLAQQDMFILEYELVWPEDHIINLRDLFPKMIKILSLSGDHGIVRPAYSHREFRSTPDRPPLSSAVYYRSADFLEIRPIPLSGARFLLKTTYLPDDISGLGDDTNPPTPEAFDMLYVYYCLHALRIRDGENPGSDVTAARFYQLYERELISILQTFEPPILSIKPRN